MIQCFQPKSGYNTSYTLVWKPSGPEKRSRPTHHRCPPKVVALNSPLLRAARSVPMQPAARLENWYTDEDASNEYEVYVKGEIYCNDKVAGYGLGSCNNGCLYQVVAAAESSDVAEGSIILDWVSGATIILCKGASCTSLADERDAARRKAAALQQELSMLRARLQTVEETRKIKRPRGRAPNGFCWDEQKAGWYDENGFEFVKVDHPARKEESKRSADARAVSALPLSLLFLLTSHRVLSCGRSQDSTARSRRCNPREQCCSRGRQRRRQHRRRASRSGSRCTMSGKQGGPHTHTHTHTRTHTRTHARARTRAHTLCISLVVQAGCGGCRRRYGVLPVLEPGGST